MSFIEVLYAEKKWHNFVIFTLLQIPTVHEIFGDIVPVI